MKKHYVCSGECKGVSDNPGSCRAKDCSKHEQKLKPCECEEGDH